MNTYVILLEDTGKQLNKAIIKSHVDHLKQLDADGHLVICGPFTDYKGGMVVVTCEDLSSAHAVAQRDPFVSNAYRTYTIRTLEVANKNNNYLL